MPYSGFYPRYADDTTLTGESKEELSVLMEVKEEREKAGLKFNIQKTKKSLTEQTCVCQGGEWKDGLCVVVW